MFACNTYVRTCIIHNSTSLEYGIIRHYTNVVYYIFSDDVFNYIHLTSWSGGKVIDWKFSGPWFSSWWRRLYFKSVKYIFDWPYK